MQQRAVDLDSNPTDVAQALQGRLRPAQLFTHRYKLSELERAYAVFARSAEFGALKVVIDVCGAAWHAS